MKLKPLFGSLLRGGLCAVWVFGALLSVLNYIAVLLSDAHSSDAMMFMYRMLICMAVTTVAAGAHAYLIYEESKHA